MSVNEKMTALADTIRAATGETEKLSIEGMTDAIARVQTAAKKARDREFWDVYQKNGNRADYKNAFSGEGWTEEFFKPRYSMQPTDAYMMFRYNPCRIDLQALLEEQGITLDFSKCTDFMQAFFYTGFTRVGVIDYTGTRQGYNIETFAYSRYLKTIDKLVIREDHTFNSSAFFENTALEELRIQGIISSDMDLRWSPRLSRESMENIVSQLSDTATGKTLTFSREAVETAYWSDSAMGPDARWEELVQRKPNWNIVMV